MSAFELTAPDERSVTGIFAIETDKGWFRAAFKPTELQAKARASQATSEPLYVKFDDPATVLNAWLGKAASDKAEWNALGVVTCPPHPRPLATYAKPLQSPPSNAPFLTAVSNPPIGSLDCSKPFAEATLVTDPRVINRDLGFSYFPAGFLATVRVDLDATGKPVAVTITDYNPLSNFEFAHSLANVAKTLQYSPAIAYCMHVPSTYWLHRSVSPGDL